MTNYLLAFLLAIPAFAANMVPVFAAKYKILPSLDKPIDGGHTWRGKRLSGDNKTWRGFVVGAISGFIAGLCITGLTDFGFLASGIFGLLGGVGALVGDAVESVFKRQLGIASGKPLIPFDQIDYILGFLFFTSFMISWSWSEMIFLLCCGAVLNPLTNIVGYFLGIKKTWW